jgi:hypothetical protein
VGAAAAHAVACLSGLVEGEDAVDDGAHAALSNCGQDP